MPTLNGKTLTRADLAEAVFAQAGLPRNEAAELVELVLKQIVYALERGESMKLSSFGSFGLRQKSERVGRNPKTGEVVPITPRRVIVFKASNIMKERINAMLSNQAGPAGNSGPPTEDKPAKVKKTAKGVKKAKEPPPSARAKAERQLKAAKQAADKKTAPHPGSRDSS
jgi:integration host factor subunit alpha